MKMLLPSKEDKTYDKAVNIVPQTFYPFHIHGIVGCLLSTESEQSICECPLSKGSPNNKSRHIILSLAA